MKFIIGRKLQMTQVFDEGGFVHPVTVVALEPMTVSQVRTNDKDSYEAVQVAYGQEKNGTIDDDGANRKPDTKESGDVKKGESDESDVNGKSTESVATRTDDSGKGRKDRKRKNKDRKEFRGDVSGFTAGESISVADVFVPEDIVRVTATSKGKGFQGVVKRYGFAGGPRTHGQKHNERQPGSIGSGLRSRVPKGTKMPGRMGGDTVTVKGTKVVLVDKERGLLMLRGSIPGRRGTLVKVQSV